MASNRSVEELAKYVSGEYGGVTPSTGTPYPCTQEQIDTYTVIPICDYGNSCTLFEYEAICMLEAFLDPNITPTPDVSAALHRIADGMNIKDNWFPDIVIKALHDIDTAFFMGLLRGGVKIQWIDQSNIIKKYGLKCADHLGITQFNYSGCCTIYLNMQPIFADKCPRLRMWNCLFHELIHAYCIRVCHQQWRGTAYDRSKGPGWSGGHGFMFRSCLLALEERTKAYLDGFCIATPEDTDDFRSLD